MKIPQRPPVLEEVIDEVTESRDTVSAILGGSYGPAPGGKYRHWDVLRHLEPPAGLTHREWWLATKLARTQLRRELPLTDPRGMPFTFVVTDQHQERLHLIDQRASGEIAVSEAILNADTRRRYVVSSLIEEAITSSQLEGANTTRRVAKEMLRSGRPPRDKSEQMILNNFQAMNFTLDIKDERLTPEIVLHLHELVTYRTLDDDRDAGRLQEGSDDRVEVVDFDENVLHVPPPASQLPERLEAMCRFANGDSGPVGFLHPVNRAILLHLWLAYDHPFVDGNGRTARALFYWSMLHQGYWLAEFLSISRILNRAPAKYGRSFLYTETDENDATYFVDYQLEVVVRAIRDLHEYLGRKMSEVRDAESLIRKSAGFNSRQLALLSHALRHSDATYTFVSHSRSHNVAWQSGRSDLLDLERRGLLERRVVGRRYVFTPPRDLADRLRDA